LGRAIVDSGITVGFALRPAIDRNIATMIEAKRVDASVAFFFNDGIKAEIDGIPIRDPPTHKGFDGQRLVNGLAVRIVRQDLGSGQIEMLQPPVEALRQIYGQTEISGISVLHRTDDVRPDTVGQPIPETELTIAPDGEILERSPAVFKGYYKSPDETARTLRDGWLHSGDKGFLTEDGHLVFFDRSKDVMILSDGRQFSPVFIESRLKFSPYIKDAWVIGHQRPFVTAVMAIDYVVVGEWAEARNIAYTTYHELSQQPKVYALVRDAIARVNKDLPEPARIQRFLNLYKEFDADDDELTRTRKLRRAFLEEKYKDIVAALYAPHAEQVHIDTSINYEDGRVVRIKADLRVMEV